MRCPWCGCNDGGCTGRSSYYLRGEEVADYWCTVCVGGARYIEGVLESVFFPSGDGIRRGVPAGVVFVGRMEEVR